MQAFSLLLSEIKKHQFAPFYLLSGTESYYIECVLNTIISKLVDNTSRDFDYTLFYGKEVVASQIIETAKRYPMIADYNLVVIKEAQSMSSESLDELASYLEKPMIKTVVVFCFMHKAFDKRKKLYKAAEKKGIVLTVKPLYENQIISWLINHSKALNLSLSPSVAVLISEHIGANLSRLDSELRKLKLVVNKGEAVTAEDVEKYVGISKEFNSFELQNAIGRRDFSKAFQIIQYLNKNSKNHPLVLILSSLHNYFQKLLLLKGITIPSDATKVIGVNPFFIKDYQSAADRLNMHQITLALNHVLNADLKSKGIKGVNQTPKRILESLLLKLFSL
jgi:DNA polymerase-3 subunit delta